MKLNKLGLLGLGTILLGSAFMPVIANADATSQDLNIQISADNTLEMALSTNQISFMGYNGTEDFTNNDLKITVSSGLNYDINAKLVDEFKGTNDNSATINASNLGIKTSTDNDYKFFARAGETVKVVENATNGKDKVHNINFKLKGDSSVKADTYNTTLQFEAVQK